MICEKCEKKFDRNPNRGKKDSVHSHRKYCDKCMEIMRKEKMKNKKINQKQIQEEIEQLKLSIDIKEGNIEVFQEKIRKNKERIKELEELLK